MGWGRFTVICLVPSGPTDLRSEVLRCCQAIGKLISLDLTEEQTQFKDDPRAGVEQLAQKVREVGVTVTRASPLRPPCSDHYVDRERPKSRETKSLVPVSAFPCG